MIDTGGVDLIAEVANNGTPSASAFAPFQSPDAQSVWNETTGGTNSLAAPATPSLDTLVNSATSSGNPATGAVSGAAPTISDKVTHEIVRAFVFLIGLVCVGVGLTLFGRSGQKQPLQVQLNSPPRNRAPRNSPVPRELANPAYESGGGLGKLGKRRVVSNDNKPHPAKKIVGM